MENDVVINAPADCGNSPKAEFLKDFNVAFAKGDAEKILSSVSDNISWIIVGNKTIAGRIEFASELEKIKHNLPREFHIDTIITHGRYGSLNGKIININGSEFSFCDVYEFTNTRGTNIKTITSYMIQSQK